jgi:hypothetical protein
MRAIESGEEVPDDLLVKRLSALYHVPVKRLMAHDFVWPEVPESLRVALDAKRLTPNDRREVERMGRWLALRAKEATHG